MKQFRKKTFLGLDVTPRRLMWARIARLEEQAGRYAADRELAFCLAAELDAKLRKVDQPRERGRFARKRVQPAPAVNAVADVASDAWANISAVGFADPVSGLSVRTLSDLAAESSATAVSVTSSETVSGLCCSFTGRPAAVDAGVVSPASVPQTPVADCPANVPDGFSVTVSSEFSSGFRADAADSVSLSCEVSAGTVSRRAPSSGFAPAVSVPAGCDAPAVASFPSCAAPASPSSPSGSGASSPLLSFGSPAADLPKSRQLPS